MSVSYNIMLFGMTSCYKEMLLEKKFQEKQSTHDAFFKNKVEDEPQPGSS
jgi:hypothetical protein